MTSDVSMHNLMAQLRVMQAKASGVEQPVVTENNDKFSTILKGAVEKVNEAQLRSGELKIAYQQGDPTVDLTQVMIASQKSTIAMQAAITVRNKFVSAYQDIMSMTV